MITKNLNELVINSSAGYGKDKNTEEYDIPVAKVSNVNAYGHFHKSFEIRSFTEKEKNKLIARDNDLFVVKSSGSKSNILSGKTALYKTNEHPELIASNFLLRLTPKEDEVNSKYLWYYLNSQVSKNYIKTIVGTTTYPNLKWNLYGKMPIPLPPLDQQKKIAAILDAADAYRQKTKTLIENYDELAQSLFLDMFGDPVTNPKGWETKTLNDVCFKITDGTHHSPTPQDSGYPYVTAKHVKPFSLQFDAKPSYVDEKAHNEIYKRCTPEYGDVLYIKDGATTGIACINTFKEPISMLSSLALLKLNDNINNQYLCHWLNHGGIKQKLISEFMSGAAIKRYTIKKIKLFKLMVPIIDLQNQFAERVQAIEAQKAQAQASLAQAEDLFNSLLQRAFKGELV